MSRTVRVLLFVAGVGIVALLIMRAGPALVLDMLTRVGWGFPAVAAIYTVHLAIRAAALQRSVLTASVRYVDVLRVRLSSEAVEMLTFTGPFLAEPAKGLLLVRRGLSLTAAFAVVATEYLLYTVISAVLAIIALSLLLGDAALPQTLRLALIGLLAGGVAFIGACMIAALTGIGLIVPIVRASGRLIGASRAAGVVDAIDQVERVLVDFLHSHPARLTEVLALETAAHALLVLEIWIVIAAMGFPISWRDPLIIEGAAKFIGIVFFFVPGQIGPSEGVYALLFQAIGLSTAAGLTLALVRRVRGLLVAAFGIAVFAWAPHDETG